jgi:signal-transduction protein with cAMP-binding, CBS, and nucleotidyltransferase domain
MNVDPEWISSGATVLEAAQVMRDRSVGMLLVFDPAPGQLRGVLTERDLATRVCADDKRAGQTLVNDIATTEVVTCGADEDMKDVEEKMKRSEKSRLVALDQGGQPIGVIGLTDILRYESHRRAVRTARAVLAQEARGRATPASRIKLTPSTPEDEAAALRQPTAMTGGSHADSMKVFPT